MNMCEALSVVDIWFILEILAFVLESLHWIWWQLRSIVTYIASSVNNYRSLQLNHTRRSICSNEICYFLLSISSLYRFTLFNGIIICLFFSFYFFTTFLFSSLLFFTSSLYFSILFLIIFLPHTGCDSKRHSTTCTTKSIFHPR